MMTGTIDEILAALLAYIEAGPSGTIDMQRELTRIEASERFDAALRAYIDRLLKEYQFE